MPCRRVVSEGLGWWFMESPLSLLRMHRDHDPCIRKSLEINESIFRFMESSRALGFANRLLMIFPLL